MPKAKPVSHRVGERFTEHPSDIELRNVLENSKSTKRPVREIFQQKAKPTFTDRISKKLNIKSTEVDRVVKDSLSPNPVTPEGQKLKKETLEKLDSIEGSIDEVKKSNGEEGKSLKDAPKTQSFFRRHLDVFSVGIIGLIGAGLVGWDKTHAENKDVCMRLNTCVKEDVNVYSGPVPCPLSICNCPSIKGCRQPECGEVSQGCPTYFANIYDPVVLASALPEIAKDVQDTVEEDKWNRRKKWIFLIISVFIISAGILVYQILKDEVNA